MDSYSTDLNPPRVKCDGSKSLVSLLLIDEKVVLEISCKGCYGLDYDFMNQ